MKAADPKGYIRYLYNILEEARQRDGNNLVVARGQDGMVTTKGHERAWVMVLYFSIVVVVKLQKT